MSSVYSKSLKDIFSFDVIIFVINMTLLSLIVSIGFINYFWEDLALIIQSYLSWIPWEWIQTSGANLIVFIFSYMIFLITLSIFNSLFSEKLLIKLAKKSYPKAIIKGSPNIINSLIITIKSSIIFIILFIIFIPLLFIPILGQVLIVYLWSILLKKPTIYDVGSLFINDKEELKEKRKKTTTLAMVASLFNYIPLLNTFAPIFVQILFLHHILGKR